MIKKIMVVVICLIFMTGVYAQDKKFTWGVKAGLNLANFVGKDAEGTKMKAGFNVGVVTEYRFCDKFAVGPELLYSTQGCSIDMPGMDEDGESNSDKLKINAQYINLPIMLKYYVIENLSINLGPQLGYAVSVKGKIGSHKMDYPGVKKFDVALGVGATYHFGSIFADARYNYGLTKVVENTNMKNSVIQIGVGYKF